MIFGTGRRNYLLKATNGLAQKRQQLPFSFPESRAAKRAKKVDGITENTDELNFYWEGTGTSAHPQSCGNGAAFCTAPKSRMEWS